MSRYVLSEIQTLNNPENELRKTSEVSQNGFREKSFL